MAIATLTRNEASESIRKSMNRASQAMESRNYDYACQILQELLHREPGFNEARFQLRQAQLSRIGFSVSWFRRISAWLMTAVSVYVKGPAQLRRGNHARALEMAEKAMNADPTLLSTLMFLRRAAKEAELPAIAVNAMEIAVRFNPKSVPAHQALATDYQETGDAQKAVSVLQKVCEMQPGNPNAVNELKRATALAAMEGGRWEQADTYKDLMKDKDKAEELEQQDRLQVRDPNVRKQLIEKNRAALMEKPDNPGLLKKLASLLHQNHDYQEAIEAYGKIMELTGVYDPGIDTQISDIIRAQYNDKIEQARENGESPEQIENLTQQRDESLLQRLEKRVENFPNELNFRLELGYLYWQLGRVDDALQQFQQTQRSPHLARKARIPMGKCFRQKELYDLAIEQFEMAIKEKDRISSNEYKEALYESGLAYEKKGDADKAFRMFKELYSMDVQFRDISERIKRYYQT